MLKFQLTLFFLLSFCRSNCLSKDCNIKWSRLVPNFQITKHLNLVVLLQRAKKTGGCFEFKVLKVELEQGTS
jgi:hypothetical protein